MRVTEFGSTKEIFVNQDEGMFVAFPITFDEDSLTLEIDTSGGKRVVKAGSVVKEGSTIRGITAEAYDVTYGPVVGRVVLEGYAWSGRLTEGALAAAASLPKIVVLPYKVIEFELESVNTTAHKAKIKLLNGLVFDENIAVSDLTVTTLTASAVALNTDKTVLEITFSGAGTGKVTAIASTEIIGAPSGSAVRGLPIEMTV